MYVTICKPCLDNDHDHCDEKVATSALQVDRERVRAAGLCGGGSCICAICDPKINETWYEEVLKRQRPPEEPVNRIGEGEVCRSRWSSYRCSLPEGHSGDHIEAKAFWTDETADEQGPPEIICRDPGCSCDKDGAPKPTERWTYVNNSDRLVTVFGTTSPAVSLLPGDTLTITPFGASLTNLPPELKRTH